MHATLNTFPPVQSMNSPRGWVLAGIVLLHAGFFWLLSSGMGTRIVDVVRGPGKIVIVDTPEPQPEPLRAKPLDKPIYIPVGVTVIEPTPLPLDEVTAPPVDTAPRVTSSSGASEHSGSGSTPTPVIVQPATDPSVRLSEPLYPASEIRAGHTGTVMLSVWVLENGKVGDVRLEQSSGYTKLDDSAMREARRWRFKPGMRDGVPTAMWKQVPVTFQLKDEGGRG
jgi:periplasmic protein TonB